MLRASLGRRTTYRWNALSRARYAVGFWISWNWPTATNSPAPRSGSWASRSMDSRCMRADSTDAARFAWSCARDATHDVEMDRRDGPPRLPLLEAQVRPRADALGSEPGIAELGRQRHGEARSVRRRDQLLGIDSRPVLESIAKTVAHIAERAAP